MKKINVEKIIASSIKAESVPALLDKNNIAFQTVENVNWPAAFPYCPEMKFRIAYTDDSLLIHYTVKEQSVRAVAQKDNDNVWEDSCVEFFSCPAGDGKYYNIECNCTGKILMAVGADRNQRTPAPAEALNNIKRWASLGSKPFDTKSEATAWEIALVVPFSSFFQHHITSMQGKEITGNFYKCGDKLPVAHFISWNAIQTDTPDFHRPEFFGAINFK